MDDLINSLRMKLEHQTLPFLFYTNSIDFIIGIQSSSLIFKYFKELCDTTKTKCPYDESDFKILFNKKYEDVYITCVEMPEAKKLFNCKRIYFTFTKDLSDMLYITIEYTTKDKNLFAGYDENGKRFELEEIGDDLNLEFQKIVFLYDRVVEGGVC